jgi:hypothetical protein
MAEPMGHIKHGKHILELKTRMSKYAQIEYPLYDSCGAQVWTLPFTFKLKHNINLGF